MATTRLGLYGGPRAALPGDVSVDITGAEAAGEAGTVTVTAERNVTGLSQLASHGLAVNTYGNFTKAGTPAQGEPTGAAAAAEAGTVTVTGDANVDATGAAAAGEAGTAESEVGTLVDATGAASAAEAGTVTVEADANVDLTGAASAGEAGTVTVNIDRTTITLGQLGPLGLHQRSRSFSGAVSDQGEPTGAAAAGEAGTITVTGDANVDATGAASAGEAGTVTVTGDANAEPSGAESAGEAGTVTVTAVTVGTVQLGPHGLTHKAYSAFSPRDQVVTILGAQANAEAGVVSATATEQTRFTQLGPHGLVTEERQFSPKQTPIQDIDAEPVGAAIELEAAEPDSAHATIYIDGAGIAGEGGSVASADAFVETAAIAGEAGTVAVQVDAPTAISGAEIAGQAGDVTGIGGIGGTDVDAQPTGAEAAGEAGTPTVQTDVNVSITGAQINGQGEEVGTDTSNDVSASVTGMASAAEAGTVCASSMTESASSVIDEFNRSSLGDNWRTNYNGYGAAQIVDNRVEQVTAAAWAGMEWLGRDLKTDQFVEFNIYNFRTAGETQIAGITLRAKTPANTGIYFSLEWYATRLWWGVQTNDHGVYTYLDYEEITDAVPDGSLLRLEVKGNRFRFYLNCRLLAERTIPNYSAQNGVELWLYDFNNTAGSKIALDDFRAGPLVPLDTVKPAGGWKAYDAYDRYLRRKKKRKQYLETIKDPVDREIAKLMDPDKVAELERIIAESYSEQDLEDARLYSERVARAYERAYMQGNYSAYMAFERELDRAREEEEFLILAMMMLE